MPDVLQHATETPLYTFDLITILKSARVPDNTSIFKDRTNKSFVKTNQRRRNLSMAKEFINKS